MERFDEGIRLFNEGHYFEAHEEWESLWLQLSSSPRKDFIRGLIMIAAALHKYTGCEYPGVEKLLQRGLDLLRANSRGAFGMDSERFIVETEAFLNKYLSGPENIESADLPKIRLA